MVLDSDWNYPVLGSNHNLFSDFYRIGGNDVIVDFQVGVIKALLIKFTPEGGNALCFFNVVYFIGYFFGAYIFNQRNFIVGKAVQRCKTKKDFVIFLGLNVHFIRVVGNEFVFECFTVN